MGGPYQVQQMKSQKRDEEALRAKEKEALAKESAARCDSSQLSLFKLSLSLKWSPHSGQLWNLCRAKAEQLREEMAAKFAEMEERMKAREGELEEAQDNIR